MNLQFGKPAIFLALCTTALFMSAQTKVTKADYGKMPDGTPIDRYTIKSPKLEISVINYGGIVTSILSPDKDGKMADVALGFDTLDDYRTKNDPHFGGTIGRYANRIAHGEFKLNGQTYKLPKNNGENTLHGGDVGFDRVVWNAKEIPDGVELTYLSKDGEQGFPGNLNCTVKMTVSGDALKIEYTAKTDKPTVVNLTNHSYFNLNGEGAGDILKHKVQIHAQRFTPVDASLIPTGQLEQVKDTPFDFQLPHAVGERINLGDEQLKLGKGYDHNWIPDRPGMLRAVAEVYSEESGRLLTVMSDQPGVQFYTGNFLNGVVGKHGHKYEFRNGLALETQHWPDSPNHPSFPTTELKPGQTYHTVTIYRLSVRK
ncbi:MAG: galactose mutarotase [Acidobacteriales bacterium]|nr:galactose mutarotase [Terriglobales bacterium]